MAFDIKIRDLGVVSGLDRTRLLASNTFPLMRQVGVRVADNTRLRFRSAISPDGAAWTSLNPDYAATKQGPGILRESGALMGSIHSRPSRAEVRIRPGPLPYAAIQHHGGTIKPRSGDRLVFSMGGTLVFARSVTLPARPYMGLSDKDRADIRRLTRAHLSRVR